MASKEQIALSDLIKSTHQNLRESAKKIGPEEAWNEHCANRERLDKYARAMQELAVNYWEKNYETSGKAVSRNVWTYEFCRGYFFGDELVRQRNREKEIAQKMDEEEIDESLFFVHKDKLKLLDVGSCYNPFKVYDIFDVTAIDIAPANENVIKCDFINAPITETKSDDAEITSFAPETFDVVVFSLLLEYLPSANLRLICCEKAYNLLKPEGLLIIITPDSKHVGANAQLMKSWRFVLQNLGFSRIKYEKLPHIHCMVFRKALRKSIGQRWVELHKDKQVYDQIMIPQDLVDHK